MRGAGEGLPSTKTVFSPLVENTWNPNETAEQTDGRGNTETNSARFGRSWGSNDTFFCPPIPHATNPLASCPVQPGR